MSVKMEDRKESKTQYVYDAVAVYDDTIHFLSRMSARYSRLLADGIIRDADELCDNCVKANAVYDSDETRKKLKEEYLLRAKAAIDALSAKLTTCFRIMLENPQGCYGKPDGAEYDASTAAQKLEKLSQKLGDEINNERDALTKLLKSL